MKFCGAVVSRMSDEKQNTPETAVYVVPSSDQTDKDTNAGKKRSIKKYVILAVSAILVVAIILTAILVGVYMFQEAEKAIVKLTVAVNKDSKQDVTSNPNSNVVQYHVQNPNYDLLVINDFNRDIQTTKAKSTQGTNCYLTPLNRTRAMDPSDIKVPSTGDAKKQPTQNVTEYVAYQVSGTPISDSSFLAKEARDACAAVSTYWLYPYCDDSPGELRRQKRCAYVIYTYCCGWFIWCWRHCYYTLYVC